MGIAYVKIYKIEHFKYIVNYISVKLVKSINKIFLGSSEPICSCVYLWL